MASKYDPLGSFLLGQYGNAVPMRFAEIERVLGFALPPSARKHRPWWSNNANNSVMTKVWLDAGFRTKQADLAGETVVFARTKEATVDTKSEGFGEAAQGMAPGPAISATRHPAFGALKGVITIMPGVDLTEPADPDWGKVYDD